MGINGNKPERIDCSIQELKLDKVLLTYFVVTMLLGNVLSFWYPQVRPIRCLIGTWLASPGGTRSSKHEWVNSNSKISCLALAEKIWQIFHGRNPHTQLCCSSHKCMFLTNVAPFKKGNKQAFYIKYYKRRGGIFTKDLQPFFRH